MNIQFYSVDQSEGRGCGADQSEGRDCGEPYHLLLLEVLEVSEVLLAQLRLLPHSQHLLRVKL